MKKQCENCENFYCESYGDGWNEPIEVEYGCKLEGEADPEAFEMIEEALGKNDASDCKYFDPGLCSICGVKLEKDEFLVYDGIYGFNKVCSNACYDRAVGNEEEIEKLMRDEF